MNEQHFFELLFEYLDQLNRFELNTEHDLDNYIVWDCNIEVEFKLPKTNSIKDNLEILLQWIEESSSRSAKQKIISDFKHLLCLE